MLLFYRTTHPARRRNFYASAFFVDPQLDEEKRFKDVKEITLSYTFFEVEKPTIDITKTRDNTEEKVDATLRRDAVN